MILADAVTVPSGGLTASRHRVEISAASDAPGWIAELRVLGELPWRPGQLRQVEVRIMSDEFRDYVASERPGLIAKRGPDTVGILVITQAAK
jgi:hypothetical protein